MRRLFTVLGCLFILYGALAYGAAGAESGDQGLMNAVSYMPLSRGSPIAVRPLDDSDQNMILQQEFERALSDRGYTVSRDAQLVLTFETRDVVGAWSGTGPRTMLELQNNEDRVGSQTPKVMLNIYNSTRGGVLNKGQSGTRIVTPSQYRIDATIDDRSNGKRLWQAWAVADLGHRDSISLTKAMIPVMVGNLGLTVKRQPFNLP
ncbi:MAG: hypothetical protein V3R66_08425 [Rhodospirillales bacterium]